MTNWGRTIQLFLVDGTPGGLRRATLHGWTGAVLVSGDATFAKMTARREVDRTGIYLLAGPDPEGRGGTRVYVGSGNSVAERIRQSAERRTFWETAIAVTTSDDDLSKGHAEYLEARLIEMATGTGRVALDNGTAPDARRRRLPEADIANMEQFLVNLAIVLPVVGIDMLKPRPKAATQIAQPIEQRVADDVVFEIQHKSGVHAEAVEEDGEFVVLEGAEALTGTGQVQHPGYQALKDELLAGGILVEHGEGRLKFAKPQTFRSPSAASSVILDRSSNGRTAWRVRGTKTTYHDHQEATAPPIGEEG